MTGHVSDEYIERRQHLHSSPLHFDSFRLLLFFFEKKTFSSQFLKHVISIRSAKTAQIAIVFTHAAWSSPNNLTSGVVNVTAMILPIGESAIRTILNISLSLEDLVIIADKLPYGRFNAV